PGHFDGNGVRTNWQRREEVITRRICFLCKCHVSRGVLYGYHCAPNHGSTRVSNQSSKTRVLYLSHGRNTQRNEDPTNTKTRIKPTHRLHLPSLHMRRRDLRRIMKTLLNRCDDFVSGTRRER